MDGHRQIEQIVEGDIVIVPANTLHKSRWNQESEVTLLMLEPSYFSEIAYESHAGDGVELIGQFANSDPMIHQIGLGLKTQLETNVASSRLYVESAVTLLSVHLLQNYSSQNYKPQDYIKGLSERKLHFFNSLYSRSFS